MYSECECHFLDIGIIHRFLRNGIHLNRVYAYRTVVVSAALQRVPDGICYLQTLDILVRHDDNGHRHLILCQNILRIDRCQTASLIDDEGKGRFRIGYQGKNLIHVNKLADFTVLSQKPSDIFTY